MPYDLSTYEGRQEARDAGYWVGQDSNGNIVAEPSSGGGGDGGGGGGGGTSAPPMTSSGGGVYQTPNGPRTLDQIQTELANAGYNGPTDPSSLYTTYWNTASAGLQSTQDAQNQQQSSAYQAYLNAQNDLQKQQLELERRQAEDAHQRALQDLQLARTADQRAQAMLELQQAQQRLAETQQKEMAFEFRQSQYTDLAKTLLQTAASLRGPRDWVQYQNFLGGGRSLEQQLFGGQANPLFGGQSGVSPSITIQDVLSQLGLGGAPGAGPGGEMFQGAGGVAKGTAPGDLGSTAPNAQQYTQPGMAAPGAPPGTSGFPQVPLPQQLNPSVWDALSPSGQQLVLGLAESGQTANGVYDPNDYLRMLNASRPYGTASRSTTSAWGAPVSGF